MRKFGGLCVVLATVVSSQVLLSAGDKERGAGNSAVKDRPADYYPLKVGTKWHYRADTGGQVSSVTTCVANIDKINDVALSRVEGVIGGKAVNSEHLSSSAKGVFRHRYNGLEISSPICVLKYPVKEGETWMTEGKIGAETVKLSCRTGQEEVEVPAGKYKAVTVQAEGHAGDVKMTTTYWFAPGVGIVKQMADIGGQKLTLELEKFEEGK